MGKGLSLQVYPSTGKEDDLAVGLTYFGKRYLVPALGRWASADPLAVHSPGSADLNLYAYVHGQLLRATDPTGLDAVNNTGGAPATEAARGGMSEGPNASGYCSNCQLPQDGVIGPGGTAGAGGGSTPPPAATEGAAGDPAYSVQGRNMPGGAAESTGSSGAVSTPGSTTKAGPTGIGPLFMAIPGPASYYIGQSLEALDAAAWGPKVNPADLTTYPAVGPSKAISRVGSIVKAVAKEFAKKRPANTDGHLKRGPVTGGKGPHNEKIRQEADRLRKEGAKILAGGGVKEQAVPTRGGHRESRRPDILYMDKNGLIRGLNVGRTKADGNPVPREIKALEDLSNVAKIPTTFTPYGR